MRSPVKRVARKAKAEVKLVSLPPAGVVRVKVPRGVLPVVAVDPVKKTVEIIPVKVPPRKKSWWESLFS